jgi:hypothetical protein
MKAIPDCNEERSLAMGWSGAFQLMMVVLVAAHGFVLAHLVQQRNNAEHRKGEHTYHAEGNRPALAIIKALDHHHEAENGEEHGDGEKGKLHIRKDLLQK